MEYKNLIQTLGFEPKNGAIGVFQKKYSGSGGYIIEVNFENQNFDYGKKIITVNKATLNFSQAENWVVLECVDRLLEKGYQPQHIILEKTWPSGHGTSGRLDILVTREDGTAYLMIECKTYGAEFDKALNRLYKDGGQLFTYFQQDKSADVIVLYTSELKNKTVVYKNEIVKIEEDYRLTNNVKDFHDRWSKLTKNNGIFDTWVKVYDFQSKALTPKSLKEITQEDSGFIFNQFLEILRHNVVSDKPNAFNKIFTLFLCKIYDEKATDPKTNEELAFQWFYAPYQYEGISYPPDDNISFQKRLTDLYKKGMKEFLEKDVTDISDADFEKKYARLDAQTRTDILNELTEIRLKKNNEFAIKEVFDDDSFEENAKVVKEIVELLQGYKIRYTQKQQYLSDFFELLLTTGLKQESGQFFTPVPIAQFIIKSLPLDKIVTAKLSKGENDNLLPTIIDYAAGSGHFVTESMHEVQRIINKTNPSEYIESTAKKITNWKSDHFDWAFRYVYGIEKDYRLVKVGKVGCYLHGDGLAQVIHSDGLGSFAKNNEYKKLLKKTDKDFPADNKQFDIVVSNPPYSVSAFKNNASRYYSKDDFELYDRLTDQSSEIECLFVERTKQLLKDGGITGIILPSSILSNTGIYTRTREIILQYFEIVAIAELGSNTFMATSTNTVVLFLRRRNNYESKNIREAVQRALADRKDSTINGIEQPISKYVSHVWNGINLTDYITLLDMQPNEAVQKHDIYNEYDKKITSPKKEDKWKRILSGEEEKLYYFILAYQQRVVLVKTGEKNEEKAFLGYEFSNRRGNEGIHPIQRGKNIDECTRLFDPEVFNNPEKASTYIYKAFQGEYEAPHPDLAANIHHLRLIDMMTFDRLDFEKNISLAVKKKRIESKWEFAKLGNLVTMMKRGKSAKYGASKIQIIKSGQARGYKNFDFTERHFVDSAFVLDERKLQKGDVLINSSGVGTAGRVTLFDLDGDFVVDSHVTILRIDRSKALPEYVLSSLANIGFENIEAMANGQSGQIELSLTTIENIKIPLPPLDIQKKIVAEIEELEEKEGRGTESISKLTTEIDALIFKGKESKKPLNYYLSEINPSKSAVIEKLFPDTDVSFLRMEDVGNDGRIIALQTRKLSEVKNGYTFFQNGDVLLAKITPCMENGKGALVSSLPNNIGFGSTEFFVLRNSERILPQILFYITQNKEFREAAEKVMTGASGHRRVPKSFVENYMIFDIPLSDQPKIISQIEAIEKQIATLETELEAIPQQKGQVLKKWL